MAAKNWISVYRRKGSRVFYCQVRDPETKQIIGTRSTRETREREALKAAQRIADEILSAERDDDLEILSFDEFVDRYDREVLSGQRKSTRENMISTTRKVRSVLSPRLLRHFARGSEISRLAASLREEGLSLYSVKRHLSNVRTLLRWAHRLELIERVPFVPVPSPRDLERTKGRAITAEEFDRMIDVTPKVVGEARSRDWIRILRGLYLSGLRLREALSLSWDEGDFRLELDSELPRFRVRKSGEKSKRGGRYPITPDFFTFLLQEFPESEREGLVFHASTESKPELSYIPNNASRVIQSIGKRAGVKAGKGRGGEIHFASAHDLRRSFGVRWARKVDEDELRRLMRHSSIETTREFYIGSEDDLLAVDVWSTASEEERSILLDYANDHANISREPRGRG